MTHSPLPVALVTGASKGIGMAIARRLAASHHILVGGRDEERVRAVVDELPSAAPFLCDLTDDEATTAAAGDITRLDVLVHSAGIAMSGTVADTPAEDWRRVLETNVVAVAGLTRLLLPVLRASQGQVVMINSGAGYTAGPGGGPYAASKFALRALADALREEERGRVRVSSIHPGRVDTEMQVELQARLGRSYRPEEHLRPQSVAQAVALAVEASPEAMVEEVRIRPVFTP